MIHSWVQNVGLLVLRVSFGSLMLVHGVDKLLNFSTYSEQFGDPIGLGAYLSLTLVVFAEFFCSVLLILGLATRLATIPLIITMLVAATVAHRADPWQVKEMAVLYLAGFVSILICGPGLLSFDWLFGRWFRRKRQSA